MSIYRIHSDRMHYQLMNISSAEVIKHLGHDYPFHIDPTPKPYAEVWETLPVSFYDSTEGRKNTSVPDITVDHGRLFLNEAAYDALSTLIEADGEILPVSFDNKDGAIFNPLKIAEELNGLDLKLSIKNEWGDLQSLGFIDESMKAANLFRCAFDGYGGLFCHEAFKRAVEHAGLKGIVFSLDLGNIFPPDDTASAPAEH